MMTNVDNQSIKTTQEIQELKTSLLKVIQDTGDRGFYHARQW
jgi:hypothetical protein